MLRHVDNSRKAVAGGVEGILDVLLDQVIAATSAAVTGIAGCLCHSPQAELLTLSSTIIGKVTSATSRNDWCL